MSEFNLSHITNKKLDVELTGSSIEEVHNNTKTITAGGTGSPFFANKYDFSPYNWITVYVDFDTADHDYSLDLQWYNAGDGTKVLETINLVQGGSINSEVYTDRILIKSKPFLRITNNSAYDVTYTVIVNGGGLR